MYGTLIGTITLVFDIVSNSTIVFLLISSNLLKIKSQCINAVKKSF